MRLAPYKNVLVSEARHRTMKATRRASHAASMTLSFNSWVSPSPMVFGFPPLPLLFLRLKVSGTVAIAQINFMVDVLAGHTVAFCSVVK